MKLILRVAACFLVALLLPAAASAVVIFSDDFEDGTLDKWTLYNAGEWTSSTNFPITGARSLQHGVSNLSAQSGIYAVPPAYTLATARVVWRINMKNGNWSPSSTTRFWFYLMADAVSTTSRVGSGYVVGVDWVGTADTVTIWRVNGSSATYVLGSPLVWGSAQTVGIEVSRTTNGLWELKTDSNGGFDFLESAGTATDTTYTDTTYCGPYYQYTATRTNQFWADDISIEQITDDPNAPVVTITNPAAVDITVPYATSTYSVQGTANTSVIGRLVWTNLLTQGGGTVDAGTEWTAADVPLNVGTNLIQVSGSNNASVIASDFVRIARDPPLPPATCVAFFNEVEPDDGAGALTNEFIEILAPAGTNLQGCFIIHYNGDAAGDGGLWRFNFPTFFVPNDGITDTNGQALGFCVIAQAGGTVANTDFALPGTLQDGEDGLVLYDASSNILDAVAWGSAGDLTTDDPGTVTTGGDPAAPNYLAIIGPNAAANSNTLQAPNLVLADDGTGWADTNATPGALNTLQASGSIDITGGGNPLAPDVAITNPAAPYTIVQNGTASYAIEGTANANVVGELAWSNSLTAATGTAAAGSTWSIPGVALDRGENVITVTGTNATGEAASDFITLLREAAPTSAGAVVVRVNEIECNGTGSDTNDFVELIAPAGTDLNGCFLVHYDGLAGGDGGLWRLDFPSFVFADAGITDTNGVPLGFCVIAQTSGVPTADFEMPGTGLQTGPDGIVLYDAASNVLDAVAWNGAGDLNVDDPGTVFTLGDSSANNFLHGLPNDGAATDTSFQAPDNVLADTGAGWTLIARTVAAINGGQTSGNIVLAAGAPPAGDTDGDGMPDTWELLYFGGATNGTPTEDGDFDTTDNLHEFIADTVPNVASSVYSNIVKVAGGFSVITLQAGPPTTNSRLYDVYWTTNLMLPDWRGVGLNRPGDPAGAAVTLSVTNEDAGFRYYRTGVKLP